MKKSSFYAQLSIYSVAHFIVDFSCILLLWGVAKQFPDIVLGIILYNGFAFAGQMPIGILADKLNRNALVAALGCILVAAAYAVSCVFGSHGTIAAAITAGVGNALFHMGGGIDVLNASDKKFGPLGIYVAPGSFGLFLGMAWASTGAKPVLVPCMLCVAAAVAIVAFQLLAFKTTRSSNVPFSFKLTFNTGMKNRAIAAIGALFLVVFLRSYVGFLLKFDWKTQWHWGVIFALAILLGKALGGILSDRFGLERSAIVSLGLCAILFCFPSIPACGVLAIFLFNMTMPMTLGALAQIFNGARGFAFGTLTCALFFGFLASMNFSYVLPVWAISMASIISLALLIFGLKPIKRG